MTPFEGGLLCHDRSSFASLLTILTDRSAFFLQHSLLGDLKDERILLFPLTLNTSYSRTGQQCKRYSKIGTSKQRVPALAAGCNCAASSQCRYGKLLQA